MAETSLKKQIMSGMVWKFAERFIAQGVSFVVSLVLARILICLLYTSDAADD